MNDTRDPKETVPGEKQPGKFHYNPVNMSGKKAGTKKNTGPGSSDPQEDTRRDADGDDRPPRAK